LIGGFQDKRRKKRMAALKEQKASKLAACSAADPHFDAADSRFAALYSNHQFALDPTDPRSASSHRRPRTLITYTC
jgi:hypothetical protein